MPKSFQQIERSSAGQLDKYSFVVLTYHRPEHLRKIAQELFHFASRGAEIIIVDNASEIAASDVLESAPFEFIRLERNGGAVARSEGMRRASREIVVTMDDDLFGLSNDSLKRIELRFETERDLGALCFRVLSASPPHRQMNWCHHYRQEDYALRSFKTDEISEGAVAFRREALSHTDYYPREFFISHEGVAIAYQLMNAGYFVGYDPEVIVYHSVAEEGRSTGRRYYFDTRNVIWVTVRYFALLRGLTTAGKSIAAIFVYALRDGQLPSWFRGVIDGLRGLPHQFSHREKPKKETLEILRSIDPFRPGLIYMAKKRLFRKGIEI